ncbi:predicted protein [Histoplasma capsulatum var. duboisii H88]|uniref:Predicted protein n=1 Tax=Ajellomyces capsulatus (strain H88) TaxID=544711 RepID=F0U4S0_AJEC8|nr:predicted protein [Histoplasma capsulatum var. duboisii H88]
MAGPKRSRGPALGLRALATNEHDAADYRKSFTRTQTTRRMHGPMLQSPCNSPRDPAGTGHWSLVQAANHHHGCTGDVDGMLLRRVENHRRVLVCDIEQCWTGGVNCRNFWLRDLKIYTRFHPSILPPTPLVRSQLSNALFFRSIP